MTEAHGDPESLLAEFLALGGGSPGAFEAWLAKYPGLGEPLREAYADWRRGRVGLERLPTTATDDRGPKSGDVVGGHRLIRPLGRGGQGTVWEAYEISMRRRVALKVLQPDRISEHGSAMLAREARVGGKLAHPGLVAVYGFGVDDGLHWIAQELVPEGRTVRDLMDRAPEQRASPRARHRYIATVCAEAAEALQAAHDGGIIHRDVKPSNLLMMPDGRVKVGDFGLARVLEETRLSTSGDVLGTYFYMSPEQTSGSSGPIDHRTDVFSLGVVLYELLTLLRPFEGDTPVQIVDRIRNVDPPDPRSVHSRIPDDLSVICAKALEKAPSARYQRMADFAADLRRHLAGEPIRARPPTILGRAIRLVKRHPAWSAFAAVVVAALSTIVALSARNLRDAASVKRLSALREHAQLVAEAHELWPPHPETIVALREWIDRADLLVQELPFHRRIQARLRERAVVAPAAPEDGPDRVALLADVENRRLALRRRCEAPIPPMLLPEPDWESLPQDAGTLLEMGWLLVKPDRTRRGQERLGLALVRRAAERYREQEIAEGVAFGLDGSAWGLLALGLDDEALRASEASLEASPEEHETTFRQYHQALVEAVSVARSPQGIDRAREELGEIERRWEALESGATARRSWSFPAGSEIDAWWHETISELVARLESLEDPATGLLSDGPDACDPDGGWSVPRRLAFASRLEEGFSRGGEYERRWREALPDIRARYGFELPVQMGLVPIGTDPRSGLWEFWHIASGVEPVRTEGELEPTDAVGIVFVLLPGGIAVVGASPKQGAPNHSPLAGNCEWPVRTVRLTPFFLSKYEMTQGQWERLAGSNPSAYSAGPSRSLRHPVEDVSWIDCDRLLKRFGLVLPSETQWEHAARAGTSTTWWTGAERESLTEERAANLRDRSLLSSNHGGETEEDWPELDDGYAVHAPVGVFSPNPFGLHDVYGNVSEMCRDTYHDEWYWMPEAWRADPVLDKGGMRVHRGGSWSTSYRWATSARRDPVDPTSSSWNVGLRPARTVSPAPATE